MFPRLHISTWLALLLAAAVIALANVPGDYVILDPVRPFSRDKICEHGWPCTWLVRNGFHTEEGLWPISTDVCRFDGFALAANLLVGLLIVTTIAAAVEWRRRRTHRLWQFTLADLLLATLAVGGATGWYAAQRRDFTRVAELASTADVGWRTEPAFPTWLRRTVGDERLSVLGVLRPGQIEFDLPGVDPAREADMAAVRAIVDRHPDQLRLIVPRYQAAAESDRRAFLGGDYLQTLPRLRHLVLERADDEVLACLEGLSDLRTLIIKDDKATLNPARAAWLGGLRQLRQLRASRRYLGAAGIAALDSLQRLEVLVMDGAGDADLAHLAPLRKLRLLELDRATTTDAGLTSLAELRRLEWLSIHSTRLTGAGFAMLDGLRRLHTLDLSYSGIDDDGLAGLGGLRSLVFLNLEFTPLTGRGLSQLASLRRLRSLRLSTTELDDRGLSEFPKLPRLEFLDLSETRVTEKSLRSLNSLGHLRELTLSKTRVASLSPLDFDQLPRLQSVGLRHAWVSDAEAERIAGSRPKLGLSVNSVADDLDRFSRHLFFHSGDGPALWELALRGPSFGDAQLVDLAVSAHITKLILESSRVTDAGLARLAKLHDLETIELAGTSIGDAGLEHLCKLPRLETLDLAYTRVTHDGLKLLAQFPALEEVGLDPSQIDATAVALLKCIPKLEALQITRTRAPWGGQYRGAKDFKEFIKLLRRDLPALSFTTENQMHYGSESTFETRGCF